MHFTAQNEKPFFRHSAGRLRAIFFQGPGGDFFGDRVPRPLAEQNAGDLRFHKAFVGRVSLYFLENKIENVG